MIKLFRKIRQNLLMENKTGKYLKYAIGEIVLVMIGILLALQVNNWNEQRKALNQERQILTTLHKEFEENLQELKFDMTRIDNQIVSIQILFNLFGEEDLPREQYVDSLILNSFGHITWNPSSYMLNDLKNSGQLSRLSNTQLQSTLFKWERHYENLLEITEDDHIISKVFLDYLRKNASLKNIDMTAPISQKVDWSRSNLGFNNLSLLNELEFENIVDDKFAAVLTLRKQYRLSAVIIEELITITEP